ncbi:cytochrome c [Geomonas anaerohicana]|uniref:Cytochrome c n=1 Tax=Geomonas anaerohicana TaxID=2798583 RepID=A0ABS0YD53_9BACT|nr:cytochrome c [Geomonas anaerohicana]MBJ6750240.1 cytochrome c [Geomonas anaerohicana]
MIKVMTVIAAAMLLATAVADAHEGQHHDKHHVDAHMAKLHKMMPRYAKAQVLIVTSLDKGDLKGVVKQTDYILSTTADLKKSTPHKNVAKLKDFQGIVSDFERDVTVLADSAKKGDLQGARAAFASVAKRCNSCHETFRAEVGYGGAASEVSG